MRMLDAVTRLLVVLGVVLTLALAGCEKKKEAGEALEGVGKEMQE